MQQSGARNAPGEFWGIWGKKQQNIWEMKQSSARNAPGEFRYFGSKKQPNRRKIHGFLAFGISNEEDAEVKDLWQLLGNILWLRDSKTFG